MNESSIPRFLEAATVAVGQVASNFEGVYIHPRDNFRVCSNLLKLNLTLQVYCVTFQPPWPAGSIFFVVSRSREFRIRGVSGVRL